MSDLLEQLRVYGEAVEEEAVRVGGLKPAPISLWRGRFRLVLLAAALVPVVGVAGVAMRLVRTDGGGLDDLVATSPREAPPATTVTAPPTTDAAAEAAPTATTAVAPVTSPPTTMPPPRITSVRGTATWVGRDPRAAVIVAACPVG